MQGLGELEAAVMDVLWRAEEPRSVRFTSVRDVTSALLSGAEAGTGVERTHVAAVSDPTPSSPGSTPANPNLPPPHPASATR